MIVLLRFIWRKEAIVTKGFFFDLNKCVGCHACVVACEIENGRDQHQPWRAISAFNAYQHPDLPVFHYSLACNHCEDAPCMNDCPAAAFVKEDGIQTIKHLADNCIGCKYCTWSCPYDAPRFIKTTGIIEKCTLCQHRLEEGKKPSCANLCPTGALDFAEIEIKEQSRIPGFTEAGINPKIEIVELRRKKGPEMATQISKTAIKNYRNLASTTPSKINLKKDWVLVLFTLLIAFLNGYFAAGMMGFMEISPWLFAGLGLISLGLSSFHLGKKRRAWRAVIHVKNSWLSREILFYMLFLGTGMMWFFVPDLKYLGYSSILLGFVAAWSADKVYRVLIKTTRIEWHSSSIFLSSLLFMSIFTGNHRFAAIILGLKLLLFFYRKIYFQIHHISYNRWLSFFRVGLGFVLPVFIWPAYFEQFSFSFLLLIISGEFIDRILFYLDADVISPTKQIEKDILKTLDNLAS